MAGPSLLRHTLNKLLLNPEYGGDGKLSGAAPSSRHRSRHFPRTGRRSCDVLRAQFPAKYRGGAFIAFHGSWNRTPAVQDGYNVTFQPFASGKPSGKFEVFADGFAGAQAPRTPTQATYRADGVAQAPDGTLYLTESVKGWV
jgi:hypothetical protein